MGSIYRDSSRSIRKSVNSSLKWGREAADLNMGAGRFLSLRPSRAGFLSVTLSHLGAALVGKFTPEITGLKHSLSREASVALEAFSAVHMHKFSIWKSLFISLAQNHSCISKFVPATVDPKLELP